MGASVIELFARHEEAVGKLYNAYARRFPKHEEFWATLTWEEQDHANKIRQLGEEIEQGRAAFDTARFKMAVIET